VIRKKGRNQAVSLDTEARKAILEGPLLFGEHISDLGAYPLSDEDKAFLDLSKHRSNGATIRELRKSNGISQETLAVDLGIDRSGLSHVETELNEPTGYKVVQINRYFGYDIHHPLTQHMLQMRQAA
jgi:DNA-binding transcriptional regulator YiaG